MSIAKKMALRMGIYVVMVGYLVCDLFVFSGPVYRSLNDPMLDEDAAIAEARAAGVVARVYFRPIFKTQIEESMKEYLWRRGRTVDATSASERKMLREVVLNQLIDEELIKLQIKVTESKVYKVDEARIEKAVEEENLRYASSEVFEELARTGGWQGSKEQELRVTARLQREDYLNAAVRDDISEEEAREWFEENLDAFKGADFESVKGSISEALALGKRDASWKQFRRIRLRFRSEGKIDIFEDILFSEAA